MLSVTQITRFVWCIAVSHVLDVLLWKSSWMMSSVIWIWTLNSIIVIGKQQIVLHWLHVQWHLKNTRDPPSTASTTLLDTRTWQKPKQDTWNWRENLLVKRGYGAWGLHRELPVFDPGRDTKFPLIAHCIPWSSTTKMLMETSNIMRLCFISDDNTQDTSLVHKIQTLLAKFLRQS